MNYEDELLTDEDDFSSTAIFRSNRSSPLGADTRGGAHFYRALANSSFDTSDYSEDEHSRLNTSLQGSSLMNGAQHNNNQAQASVASAKSNGSKRILKGASAYGFGRFQRTYNQSEPAFKDFYTPKDTSNTSFVTARQLNLGPTKFKTVPASAYSNNPQGARQGNTRITYEQEHNSFALTKKEEYAPQSACSHNPAEKKAPLISKEKTQLSERIFQERMDNSSLSHLKLPKATEHLSQDKDYEPSESAKIFADHYAPYHQAFSHTTSVSPYSYGTEYADLERQVLEKTRAYKQRLANKGVAEPVKTQESKEPSAFIKNNEPKWWRDRSLTEQSAKKAFALDGFKQTKHGAYIGTPEQYLPKTKEESAFNQHLIVSNNYSVEQLKGSSATVISSANLNNESHNKDSVPEKVIKDAVYEPVVESVESVETTDTQEESTEHVSVSKHGVTTTKFTGQGAALAHAIVSQGSDDEHEEQDEGGHTNIERSEVKLGTVDKSFVNFKTADGSITQPISKNDVVDDHKANTPSFAVNSSDGTSITTNTKELKHEVESRDYIVTEKDDVTTTISASLNDHEEQESSSNKSSGSFDFGDFKTANGSQADIYYRVPVVSQKQLQAQREQEKLERIAAQKQAEQERLEQERLAALKAEQERIEAERKAEEERQAALKAEQERIEAEKKAEEERQAALKAEQERIEAEKKAEEERQAALKAEQERIEAEKKAEQERIEAEKKAEEERQAALKAEQERIEAEKKAEQERIEAEKKAEEERQAALKAEQERIEAEKKAEEERQAALKAEQERIEAEKKAEEERQAALKAEQERIEAEKKAQEEATIKALEAEQARLEAEKEAELKVQEQLKQEREAQAKDEKTQDDKTNVVAEAPANKPMTKSQARRAKQKAKAQARAAAAAAAAAANNNVAQAQETKAENISFNKDKSPNSASSSVKSEAEPSAALNESTVVADEKIHSMATALLGAEDSYFTDNKDEGFDHNVVVNAQYTHHDLETDKDSVKSDSNFKSEELQAVSNSYTPADEQTANILAQSENLDHGKHEPELSSVPVLDNDEDSDIQEPKLDLEIGKLDSFDQEPELKNVSEVENIQDAEEPSFSNNEQLGTIIETVNVDNVADKDLIFAAPTRFAEKDSNTNSEQGGSLSEAVFMSDSLVNNKEQPINEQSAQDGLAAFKPMPHEIEASNQGSHVEHDPARAVQEAVADVVADSLVTDELLDDAFMSDDTNLEYMHTSSSHDNGKNKGSNSLANLAAELIDDFDDPFEDDFAQSINTNNKK